MKRPATSHGIASRLLVLALVAISPLLAFVVASVHRLVYLERDALARSLTDAARVLTVAVDKEVESSITTLQAMTAWTWPETGDLQVHEAYLRRVRDEARPAWADVALITPSGEILLALGPAQSATSPPASAVEELMRTVATTGKPVVSDLRRGEGGLPPSVLIAVPVRQAGASRFALAAWLDVATLGQILARQRLGEGWDARVLDRQKITMVRVPPDPGVVGNPADPQFLAATRDAPAGWHRLDPADGQAIYVAYAQSELTGWTVWVSAPAYAVEAFSRRWSFRVVGVGLAAVALGVLVAVTAGRRIARPIQTLSAAAEAFGRGDPVPPPQPSGLREADAVARAFAEAARARTRADAERSRLLARAEIARADAERANHAKDAFLATLGHELRNPLAAVINATAILEQVAPADAARLRSIIDRQTKHLARLLDDLLDVSRLTSGKITLERQPVDLADVARRGLASLREAGRTQQHDVQIAAEPVLVDGDALRLEQITGNLLDNALKHTPPGGQIRLGVARDGDRAILRVEDTGAGIEPELLGRIFDPFVQAEQSLERRQGGLGLGLALVRRLVELHGGTVGAASAGLGRGSQFVVTLPALADLPGAMPAAAKPADAGASRRRRVLIVEDNTDARESLRALLEVWGHEVHEAADGPAGVAAALSVRPDVALLDIGLPGFDGYALAHHLRGALPDDILLVAVSGYGQPHDRERATEAGFDAHLVKPVAAEELRRVLVQRRPQPGEPADT